MVGYAGFAIDLDGANDYLVTQAMCPRSSTADDCKSPSGFRSFTFAAWARPGAGTSALNMTLAHKGAPGRQEYLIAVGNGQIRVKLGGLDGRWVHELSVDMTFTEQAWHHLAAVWDGAHIRVYHNAVLVGTGAKVGLLLQGNESLIIGGTNSGSSVVTDLWKGTLDETYLFGKTASVSGCAH